MGLATYGFRLYWGRVYSVRVMFGSGILDSGLIRVELRQVGIESVLKRVGYGSGMGCPFSVHFGLGHYGSGMTWVGSFRVWVISGVD